MELEKQVDLKNDQIKEEVNKKHKQRSDKGIKRNLAKNTDKSPDWKHKQKTSHTVKSCLKLKHEFKFGGQKVRTPK